MSRNPIYIILGLALLAAEVLKPKREDLQVAPSRENSGTLRGVIIGAALAMVASMTTTVWSNYLTRRDEHVQKAETCRSLMLSLLSTISFAHEIADSAVSSIAAPVPAFPNVATNKFVLPPVDEILHSQDQFMGILDPNSRDSVLRFEAYYRALRDDLSGTSGIYHTGETFGVPPSSGDKDAYENLMKVLARGTAGTIQILNASFGHCDDLAKTSPF